MTDLLTWCREERKRLQQTLELMETGKLRLYEGTSGDWDVTPERMEEIRATLVELDKILARHRNA